MIIRIFYTQQLRRKRRKDKRGKKEMNEKKKTRLRSDLDIVLTNAFRPTK